MERGTQELGRPVPLPGNGVAELIGIGKATVVRESDRSIVLGDGKADHMGKGATELRSSQRKHDAEENACYRHANLTAGNSDKGEERQEGPVSRFVPTAK